MLLSADKSAVFYEGTLNDKNPQDVGPKTFVDRFVIKTGEKTRIFESSNDGVFESVVAILDPDAKKFIVAKESPTVVEQSYLVTDGGTRTTLTKNVDPAEDLTAAVRERFYVTRPDGTTNAYRSNARRCARCRRRRPTFRATP